MTRRWLNVAAAAVVLIAAGRVYAAGIPEPGLQMDVYGGLPSPQFQPWETPTDWQPCYSGIVSQIDFDWSGGAPAPDCPTDFFLVHFTGWLTVPESGTYEFLNWSDDGWRMTLDGAVVIDDWNLHGCGGHWSGPNEGYSTLEAGRSYQLDVWMYEWGGGACARLWYGGPQGYGVVPAAWLTTAALDYVPSPEPTIEPSASPEPTPEPSPEETSTPAPSVAPSPDPSPLPSPEQSVSPLPSPLSPSPSPTPRQSPQEPSNSPSPSPTPAPESASPSVAPSHTPEPSSTPEPPAALPIPDVGAAVAFVADLGHDISPAEKRRAAPIIVAAVVVTQVAQAAAAAAAASAASTPGGRKGRK